MTRPTALVPQTLKDPKPSTLESWQSVVTHVVTLVRALALPALMVAAALTLTGVVSWLRLRRRADRLAAASVYIAVRPPPAPELGSAELFWRVLGAHLTSRRSWGMRRPPVVWQYTADPDSVQIGLWIPPTVHTDAVCRAVTTHWVGATATPTAPPPDTSASSSAAGVLRLHAPGWLPFNSRPAADGLRLSLAVLGHCETGQTARLTVSVRPASRRHLAQAYRHVRGLRTGRPAGALIRILDALPLQAPPPSTRSPGPADPGRLAQAKAAEAKLAGGQLFEVSSRYLVTGGPEGRAGRQHRRQRLLEIGRSFAAFNGEHNRLVGRTMRSPKPSRPSAVPWLLLSVEELAALAHLPADPAAAGIRTAAARRVSPPPEVPYP